jgi:hypothetical protein
LTRRFGNRGGIRVIHVIHRIHIYRCVNRALTNRGHDRGRRAPDHRRRARRLAKEAIAEGHRRMILQIAETWRLLAEQRDRMATRSTEPTADAVKRSAEPPP